MAGLFFSPCGLGWSGREEFPSDFWFLHNIQALRDVFNKSAVTGGGGCGDMLARTNETSPSPLLHGGSRVKQSQFGSPAGTRGTMMPNKPNCPKRGTEAVSRSRPADRIPSIPLFYHSTIPVRCRWCKTKPISRCAQWAGAGRRGRRRAIVPNKAKVGQDERSGGRHIRDAYCAKQTQLGRVSGEDAQPTKRRTCETNPIR
jgi:hypothetical protein